MLNRLVLVLIACIAAGFAAPALASAPEPARRVDLSSYSGRWYEVARIPNRFQRNCAAPFVDYALDGARLRATQQCAAVNGRAGKVYRSSGRILDPGANAKVRLTFMGFWSQEYWIIDHDPAAAWALVGDPAGKFIWVMFRNPAPPQPAVAAAVARVGALGYDVRRLEYAGARR